MRCISVRLLVFCLKSQSLKYTNLSKFPVTWVIRVFKNGMISRIFGPKRVEVTGDWIKLRNFYVGHYDTEIKDDETDEVCIYNKRTPKPSCTSFNRRGLFTGTEFLKSDGVRVHKKRK